MLQRRPKGSARTRQVTPAAAAASGGERYVAITEEIPRRLTTIENNQKRFEEAVLVQLAAELAALAR